MSKKHPKKNHLRDLILDLNQTPVARMRLFSDGINQNTRLFLHETAIGDRACLACGNCVDACPVVKDTQRFVFIQNQRTSMALEHIVSTECRRCYSCIQSCPQVTKENKEYAASYRRGEKVVHMLLAMTILLLAATGITKLHYHDILPGFESAVLDITHRVLGIILITLPFVYYIFDRRHLFRLFRKVFVWNKNDIQWIKDLYHHLRGHKKYPMPYTGEFNTGQKTWYLFITCMIPIMSVTGLMLALEFYDKTDSAYATTQQIHMAGALVTDILLLLHIYLKYLRKWAINIYDIIRVFIQERHLNYSNLYENKL